MSRFSDGSIMPEYRILFGNPLLKEDKNRPNLYTITHATPLTQPEMHKFNLAGPGITKILEFQYLSSGARYAIECKFTFNYKNTKGRNLINPHKELYHVFDGAFVASAIQDKSDELKYSKYLQVNVYTIRHVGRVGLVLEETDYTEIDGGSHPGVIEDDGHMGVNVNVENMIRALYDRGNIGKSGVKRERDEEPVPDLYEDKLADDINEARMAQTIYSEEIKQLLKLQEKFDALKHFYSVLYVERDPENTDDATILRNMSDIEIKNYIEKLYNFVIRTQQLSLDAKEYYKNVLKSLYNKIPLEDRIEGIIALIKQLNKNNTIRSLELIKLISINNTVPILDEHYDDEWMKTYLNNIVVKYLEHKLILDSVIQPTLGSKIDAIRLIMQQPNADLPESRDLINELLQEIKSIFLPVLIKFLNDIQTLSTYHPMVRKHFLVNIDDLSEAEQALSILPQFFASAKLDKTRKLKKSQAKLDSVNAGLDPRHEDTDDEEEFGGGSRSKQKKKTRKRTKNRNKKRNKSKRHKGYSRR